MHPLEDAIAAIAAVCLWEAARWGWLEVQSRRAIYSQESAVWSAFKRGGFARLPCNEMVFCPPAEDYNDEDWLS